MRKNENFLLINLNWKIFREIVLQQFCPHALHYIHGFFFLFCKIEQLANWQKIVILLLTWYLSLISLFGFVCSLISTWESFQHCSTCDKLHCCFSAEELWDWEAVGLLKKCPNGSRIRCTAMRMQATNEKMCPYSNLQ